MLSLVQTRAMCGEASLNLRMWLVRDVDGELGMAEYTSMACTVGPWLPCRENGNLITVMPEELKNITIRSLFAENRRE